MEKISNKTYIFLVFFIFISAAYQICSAGEQKETPKSLTQLEPPINKYPIRAGDKLNIQVYREKDLTGIFIVDNAGNISYPLLGILSVQGMSLEELRQHLMDELKKDYLVNPQVQVDFEESLNKSVSILGHVSKPGNYDYAPNMTLVRLISNAGGFTLIAAPKHVKITRRIKDGKIKTFQVNVDEIMGGQSEDVPLESGDLVMVPETLF